MVAALLALETQLWVSVLQKVVQLIAQSMAQSIDQMIAGMALQAAQ